MSIVMRSRKIHDDWKDDYKAKLITAEEAAAKLEDGDKLGQGGGNQIPHGINEAIAKRIEEGSLNNINIYGGLALKYYDYMKPEHADKVKIHTCFVGPMERFTMDMGITRYIPMHLNQIAEWEEHEAPIKIMFSCTPPDENGFMNRSCFGGLVPRSAITDSDLVIVEVNEHNPWLMGEQFLIHVSEVDFITECHEPLFEIPDIPVTEVERTIAGTIADMIPDEATIQLGLGGLANVIGYSLRNKKNLGLHTEVITNSMADLMKAGVINNVKKNYHPHKSCATFCVGDQSLWDYVDHNDKFYFTEVGYNNDPYTISQNNDLHSVNNALCMDLTGQVAAESIRHRQYSATGGQMNFMQGSGMSHGGKNMLALPSTYTDGEGRLRSTIVPFMPPGTVVTTPRSEPEYIVTEYGVAYLRYQSVERRIKAMINIAHPEFREGLAREAAKYWK